MANGGFLDNGASAVAPAPGTEFGFTPTDGTMVLFPSWMPHRVAPSELSTGAGPRVSLSFNLEGDWSDAPAPQHVALTESGVAAPKTRGWTNASATHQAQPKTPQTDVLNKKPGGGTYSIDRSGGSGRGVKAKAGAQPNFIADREAVEEVDAAAAFAAAAQKLMIDKHKQDLGYGKRPQGMPERRKRD